MARQLQLAAIASIVILFLALSVAALPVLAVFFSLLSVYLVTTATMDAIVDQRCGCAALRRMMIRYSLRQAFLALTLLALTLALIAWVTR
jgi:hypothetical protein